MNSRILMLAAGVATGYVLGARAGRERYDQMKAQFDQIWQNPRVAKARKDVETYTRQQAPIIRERAEAAVKAAPGVVADAAKDAAEKVSTTAKDVASQVSGTAKDVAGQVSGTAKDFAVQVSGTAKDVAGQVSGTAKDVSARASAAAKDVADRVGDAASDVRDRAGTVAADLRERGESAIDTAVLSAGQTRDQALAPIDDDDDLPNNEMPGDSSGYRL